jgi:SAM-dependent methyltransferase
MLRKGWFTAAGVQDGERTLEEQMTGLDLLLGQVKDKTVMDLGCAEGLIAEQVANAGAKRVIGVESIAGHVMQARRLVKSLACTFHVRDLNDPDTQNWIRGRRPDVTLMLAVLHKLAHPETALLAFAEATRELAVIRLPLGSTGQFITKFTKRPCDVNAIMAARGFRIDHDTPGPRGERVQYWRRVQAQGDRDKAQGTAPFLEP